MALMIRPRPLPVSRLPENERLGPPPPGNDVQRPPLQDFLQDVLREGHQLICDGPLNNSYNSYKKKKRQSGVFELYRAKLGPDRLPVAPGQSTANTEVWVGTKSVHVPGPARETATYSELTKWLRREHVESQKEYMPDISAIDTLMVWDCTGVTGLEKFSDITASVHIIIHRNKPTRPRVLSLLVVTAAFRPHVDPIADDQADLTEEAPQKVPLSTIQEQDAPEQAPDPPASTAKQETSDAVATSGQQPKQVQQPEQVERVEEVVQVVPKTSRSTDPLAEHEPGFIIIRIPLDLSDLIVQRGLLPRFYVNAHYAGVEMVRRIKKDRGPSNEGKLEWARAASCDPQGNVLKHVARASWCPGCSCRRLVREGSNLFDFIASKRIQPVQRLVDPRSRKRDRWMDRWMEMLTHAGIPVL